MIRLLLVALCVVTGTDAFAIVPTLGQTSTTVLQVRTHLLSLFFCRIDCVPIGALTLLSFRFTTQKTPGVSLAPTL